MNKMINNYTCQQRTRRWPMVLWYNMLDVATFNAYTNFTAQHPDYMDGATSYLSRSWAKSSSCLI